MAPGQHRVSSWLCRATSSESHLLNRMGKSFIPYNSSFKVCTLCLTRSEMCPQRLAFGRQCQSLVSSGLSSKISCSNALPWLPTIMYLWEAQVNCSQEVQTKQRQKKRKTQEDHQAAAAPMPMLSQWGQMVKWILWNKPAWWWWIARQRCNHSSRQWEQRQRFRCHQRSPKNWKTGLRQKHWLLLLLLLSSRAPGPCP